MELVKAIVYHVGMMLFTIQYYRLAHVLKIIWDLLIQQGLVIITTELIIITKVKNAFTYATVAKFHKVKNA